MKTTKKFETLKQILLTKAKDKKACQPEYKRAYASTNEAELLKVICDNLNWCHDNQVIDWGYLNKFKLQLLVDSGITNIGLNNSGYSNTGNYNTGNRNAGNYNTGNYNTGNRNAGNDNTGNRNAGNYNTGNYNTGNRNTGNYNTGNYNTGNRNAGYSNAGNDNTGNYNTGNYNTGNRNAGYSNAGNYNTGNDNAGYSNAGNDNAGAFNTQSNFMLFNKPTNMTFEDFRNTRAFDLLHTINTTLWVKSNIMNEQEKKDHPYHVTTGGYNKVIPYKEAFTNKWNNWDKESREAFTSLQNFDAEIFFEITGAKI